MDVYPFDTKNTKLNVKNLFQVIRYRKTINSFYYLHFQFLSYSSNYIKTRHIRFYYYYYYLLSTLRT